MIKKDQTNHAAKVWFQKPLFVRLEDEHDMDTEAELSMRKLKKSKKSSHEIISMEETAGVKVTKDVDVSDTDTDGDSTESYEEEVTKTTKGYNPKGVQYAAAKKGMGRRVSRPAGVSGHFKVVDPRMKKDSQKQNAKNKSGRKRSKH